MKNKNQKQKNRIVLLLISLACFLALFININSMLLEREIEKMSENSLIVPKVARAEEWQVEKVEEEKSEFGKMGIAIKKASAEFDVPETLIIGIANAESGLGKYFYREYDRENCFNWWGLKGGNMKLRDDGSYLRCFIDEEAGARTMAKTLRNYYLDEGKDTPAEICQKWVGSKFANKKEKNGKTHCENWVANVNKYHK